VTGLEGKIAIDTANAFAGRNEHVPGVLGKAGRVFYRFAPPGEL
jgi:hypothetical protein